jgi:uncharacterized hydrophobic protein (TIGR00271 family)
MPEATSDKRLFVLLTRFIRDRFNLETDKADELEAIEYIRRGVEFKGPNLWILVFAILIASIGLNVNSTAVIIGAMLISPLMGPILGIGTGAAINDPDLLKKSLTNLLIATLFSVATSTLYFSISPLSEAQSELLARTNPTIWDVLIAFFGGLAGIVAGSRKEKSNAIPGVAIATALMPPLCTAGYGIATGNLYYFLGAFYLYFINGVFISLATFLIVRILKYPKKQFVDQSRERRVRTWITFFVIITIVPSTYMAYLTVQRSLFERNALRFVSTELEFDGCQIINKQILFDADPKKIEVTLFGERIPDEMIENARKKLDEYNVQGAELVVFQGYDPASSQLSNMIQSQVVEELYKQNEKTLVSKDEQIRLLEREITTLKRSAVLAPDIAQEVKALHPTLKEFALDRAIIVRLDSMKQDTTHIAYVKFTRKPTSKDLASLQTWLKARIKSDRVEVVLR